MWQFLNNLLNTEAIPITLQKYLGEPDVRTSKLFPFNSPLNLLGIYSIYAALILTGSRIMRNRKPFELRTALIVYNCFQVLFAAYISKEIFLTGYLSGYNPSCAKLDTTDSETAIRMINAFWYFYLSKIVDLMDTVFFVLRKKHSQLTFLHVYHHSSMIFNWYLGILYLPGGQSYFSAGLNSFVHVIMYAYYMLAAMGPRMQKHLWWKKYLTQVQLVQFSLVMLHIMNGCRYGCHKPPWLVLFTITYLLSLMMLFSNFYFATYNPAKCIRLSKKPHQSSIDVRAGGDIKLD